MVRVPVKMAQFDALERRITACRRCPRLREHCREMATVRRAAYRDWTYWGKPVPGFGDPSARLWIIGLAPGAHGANRTGRVFTGDRSGDFLYAALHRTGFASQPTSISRDDGLTLRDCYISAAVRCAPPGNKPLPVEINACAPFLDQEWEHLRKKRVILALGSIAWDAAWRLAGRMAGPQKRPPFKHGAAHPAGQLWIVASYHVSQQNTFTGRLTAQMFDEILRRCGEMISLLR